MYKSIGIVVAAAIAGAILAVLSVRFHLLTGWAGGLALIFWAVQARKKWARIETLTGLEPGGPERVLRLRATGTALLLGHLIAGLCHHDLDLHVGQGNSLAIDSWTMFSALLIAGLLFRRDKNTFDERDEAITERGTKAGYFSLITMLVLLLTLLGFLPIKALESLNYFTLANILVAIILASIVFKHLTELVAYAKDTEAARLMEMGL